MESALIEVTYIFAGLVRDFRATGVEIRTIIISKTTLEDRMGYVMKQLSRIILVIPILFIFAIADVSARGKIIRPKECRVSNYTCVLKKTDGVPFWCVRTQRQRQQNARKKMRIVSRRKCIRRYPVEYEIEKPVQQNQEG